MRLPRRLFRCLACMAFVVATTVVHAQSPDPTPPAPGTDGFDWLQFKNGEWLKGELKDVLDDSVVFESDELDEFKLDLDDIQVIITPRKSSMVLIDRTVVEGTLRIDGNSVFVTNEHGEQVYTRGELRSVIPGGRREWNLWSGKISFGTTVLSGNTDQVDVAGYAKLQRRDALSRLSIEYNGAVGEIDGTRTTNNHRGLTSFDIYVSQRLFVRAIRIDYFSDEFQNIDYRVLPSVGAGYDVVDDDELTWTVGAGLGWEFTRFRDPLPGEPETQDSPAVLAGTRLDWEVTSDIDLGYEFDITVPIPSTNDFNFRSAITAEIEIFSDFDLDVQFIWDHNNNPAQQSDGTVPDQDDYRLYIGVGWNF